jgi:MFS transporter, NRE family, putaive nickel resistance protein
MSLHGAPSDPRGVPRTLPGRGQWHPRFGRLSLAVGVSALGDPISLTLSQFLLYRSTHSAFALAGIYLSQIAAAILVGLFAGSVADRLDRRSLVAVLELGRAVLVALLPVATLISPLTLYPALFLIGGVEAVVQPARLAGVPGMVGSDHVERASARLLLLTSIGQAAGFAIAGGLIAVLPEPRALFLVDAVTFAVAGLLVMSVGSLGGGVTQVKLSGAVFRTLASPRLRPHLLVAGVVAVLTTMLAPSLLPLSYELSGSGVTIYAWLQVLLILGATVGSLVALRTGGRPGVLAMALWLFGLGVLGAGLAHTFLLTGLGIGISAVGNTVYFIVNQSTLLKAADERSRGSVMSTRYSVVQVSRVVGLGAGAAITSLASGSVTFRVTGLLLVLVAAIVTGWWLRAGAHREPVHGDARTAPPDRLGEAASHPEP